MTRGQAGGAAAAGQRTGPRAESCAQRQPLVPLSVLTISQLLAFSSPCPGQRPSPALTGLLWVLPHFQSVLSSVPSQSLPLIPSPRHTHTHTHTHTHMLIWLWEEVGREGSSFHLQLTSRRQSWGFPCEIGPAQGCDPPQTVTATNILSWELGR